jgi:hypothetical protein
MRVNPAVNVQRLQLVGGERRDFRFPAFLRAEEFKEGSEVVRIPPKCPGGFASLGNATIEPADELVEDGGNRRRRGRGNCGIFPDDLQLRHLGVIGVQDFARHIPCAAALFWRRHSFRMFAERVPRRTDLEIPGVAFGFEKRLGMMRHGKPSR